MEECKQILDSTGLTEIVVFFHIDSLSRKYNVTHRIVDNSRNQVATFLVHPEDSMTRHQMLVQLIKLLESNIDPAHVALNGMVLLVFVVGRVLANGNNQYLGPARCGRHN